jgi:hypothetical protein
MDRPASMMDVRRELAAISTARVEKTLHTGTRVAMVTIASAWSVFGLSEIRSANEITAKIDQFIGISATPEQVTQAEPIG